jgi:peptidoglycan L-alanyl-D-glutamate endopeptidase CwlK
MKLDDRSVQRLDGVHPDLVVVVNKAAELTDTPFMVVEGLRDLERQKKLVAAGASTTMRSRHLTGHAVDLAAFIDMDGSGDFTKGDNIRWDWPLALKIAAVMKTAAFQLNIPLEWGGDWVSFKDGPHFQLPWHEYPIT